MSSLPQFKNKGWKFISFFFSFLVPVWRTSQPIACIIKKIFWILNILYNRCSLSRLHNCLRCEDKVSVTFGANLETHLHYSEHKSCKVDGYLDWKIGSLEWCLMMTMHWLSHSYTDISTKQMIPGPTVCNGIEVWWNIRWKSEWNTWKEERT